MRVRPAPASKRLTERKIQILFFVVLGISGGTLVTSDRRPNQTDLKRIIQAVKFCSKAY